jgi:hypothetical protein
MAQCNFSQSKSAESDELMEWICQWTSGTTPGNQCAMGKCMKPSMRTKPDDALGSKTHEKSDS